MTEADLQYLFRRQRTLRGIGSGMPAALPVRPQRKNCLRNKLCLLKSRAASISSWINPRLLLDSGIEVCEGRLE